jgi:hypothetical protein
MSQHYQSLDEIVAVVRGFETCETKPEQFSHRAHITVCVWYLSQSNFDEAERKMKEGLYRFLLHYGLHGYNETITMFWLKVLQQHLSQSKEKDSIVNLVNEIAEACGDSKIIFHHYSKEILQTDEAKTTWVEPDLLPFNGDSFSKISCEHERQANQ